MKIKLKLLRGPILFMTILFVTVAALISGMIYYTYAMVKEVKKDGVLYIPTGATVEERSAILIDSGFLQDTSVFNRFVRSMNYRKVYPGKYTLKEGMSYRELLAVVGRGMQTPINVTFNNIRDFEKLASVVSRYIEPDSTAIYQALMCDTIREKYGFDRENFIGMFIPETYQLYWDASAEEFIARMNKEYEKFWSKESRIKALEELGYSKQQVVTLAAIVYEETKVSREMPTVAGVYINRIKAGIPLQADPTVKFALGDPTIRRVLHKDLEIDSPYNTYKYAGLTPGPITMPPAVAIDAVLEYEKHKMYYFCASPDFDGTHRFAKTLSEHNRNAAAYSAALNRRKIYR